MTKQLNDEVNELFSNARSRGDTIVATSSIEGTSFPRIEWNNESMHKELSFFNDAAFMQVQAFVIFDLPWLVKDESKRQSPVQFGDWFRELNTAQDGQLIDYLNSLLKEHGLKLIAYGRGHHYGYVFG